MGTPHKKIAEGTYMLQDAFMGVNQFLLTGKERALLIDTGYGKKSLPRTVAGLTSLPLVTVNTHLHPDHGNGNGFFGEVYVDEADVPYGGIPSDVLLDGIKKYYDAHMPFLRPLFSAVGRMYFMHTEGVGFKPLPQFVELGDRRVDVLRCPGHTAGSVLFADSITKTVFSGDAINKAQWLFTCAETSTSDYASLWEGLKERLTGYKGLWISHGRKMLPFDFIDAFVRVLRNVKPEKCRVVGLKGTPEPLMIYSEKDAVYGKMSVWAYPSQMR